MMKKDRGMSNFDLDRYPNSYLHEFLRDKRFNPQLIPFEEFCKTEKAARGLPSPLELGIEPLWRY